MALRPVGVSLTADGASAFNAAMKAADQAVTGFGQSATAASTKVSGFGQIVTGALRQVGAIATNALASAGRSLVGLGVDSIKVAGDFEAGMNQFEIAVGRTIDGSGKSLGDFRNLFIQLGKELPVSTSEVEQAAIEMSRGGIDPATIAADGLRRTIQFAAASLKGDLTQAADISAKTMQAWTNTTDDTATKTTVLAHAQDLLTQATTAASTTVPELFLGLSNVGGVARLAGLDIDQTVTSLAQLTPSFASSADAGTSFKVFLQRLLPTGKAQIAQMKDLGLYTDKTGSAFYDAQGKFVGMGKAEELLHAATMNLTDAQREMALGTIFGTDAIRSAAVFATQGVNGYDAIAASIAKQSDVAQAAAITQRGLNVAWENAKGSVEAFQITVGSKAIPALTDLLNNGIAPSINAITDWSASILNAANPWSALVTSIDGALPGFAGLTTFIQQNLTPILIGLGASLAAIVVPALVSAALAAAAAVAAFLPVLAPIVAIGAAATALYVAWNTNFLGIQTTLTTVWGAIQPIFTDFSTVIGTITTLAGNVASAFGDGGIGAAFTALVTGLPTVTDAIGTWVANVGTILTGLATSFVEWIPTAITNVQVALPGIWTAISTWVGEQVGPLLTGVLAWADQLPKWIPFAITNVENALPGIWTKISTWIGEQVGPILTKVLTWAEQLPKWIPTAITNIENALPGIWTSISTWIGDQVGPLLTKLDDWSKPFRDWVGPAIPGFLESLGAFATAIGTSIVNGVPVIVDKVKLWSAALVDWINATALPALKPAFDGFLEELKTQGGRAVTVLSEKGNKAGIALTDGFKVGWAGAPVAAGVVTGLMRDEIVKQTPGYGIAGRALGETVIDSFAKILFSETPGNIIKWGSETQSNIANLGPLLVAASLALGYKAAKGAYDGFFDLVKTYRQPLIDIGVTAVTLIAEGIKTAEHLAGYAAGRIGVAILAGIAQGLGDIGSWIAGKITGGLARALAAVRAHQQIHSPSQLWADEVGTPIAEGIAYGVDSGMEIIHKSLDGIGLFIPPVLSALQQLFTPPDTHGMIDALAAVKGTVTDLGALLNGNSTGSSIEGDTKTTFTSIVDLTHQAWEQVRVGISNAVIDAKATVDTATKAILQVSTDSFTKLRATSDLAWGQIHRGITDQITLTQANVKLSTDEMQKGTTDTFQLLQSDSQRIFGQIHLGITDQIVRTQAGVKLTTDDMHKATTATWGLIGADAASGWQKVKANIETPVSAAKDTVTTVSDAMQQKLVIPPETQDAIFQTYRHVTDTMIAQLEKVTTQIDNVTEAWGRLSKAKGPQGPSTSDLPSGYGGGRASGGPVMAGMAYTVGERGKELFMPQTNGSIVPAAITSQLLAGLNQRVSPPASAQQITNSAVYNQQTTNMFNLTAQYRYQSERSLMQDVKTLQLLHPSI